MSIKLIDLVIQSEKDPPKCTGCDKNKDKLIKLMKLPYHNYIYCICCYNLVHHTLTNYDGCMEELLNQICTNCNGNLFGHYVMSDDYKKFCWDCCMEIIAKDDHSLGFNRCMKELKNNFRK